MTWRFLLGLLLAVTLAARAQELVLERVGPAGFAAWSGPLALEQALELGLKHSLPLRVARAELEMAQADVLRASSEGRLKMSVGGYLLWSERPMMWGAAPTVMPELMAMVERDSSVLRANLMYPLFTGGLLESRLKAAEEGEKAAIAEVASALQQLLFRVRTAYFGVLLTQQKVELAEWLVTEQEEALRIFEEQLESGRVAPYVVYRARAEAADAHQEYNRARAALTEAETVLKAAMGVSVSSRFTYPEEISVDGRATDLETDIALALTERPDLMAARHGVSESLDRIAAVEAEYLPQVYLGAQYQGVAMRGASYDGGFSGGLSVAIPILDGGERRARLEREKATREARELRLREAELQVTRQVTAVRARWEAAVTNADLARREVEEAEEELRISRLRNALGRSIYLETLDALAAAGRARLNLMQARHDAAVALAELLLVTGGASPWGDEVGGTESGRRLPGCDRRRATGPTSSSCSTAPTSHLRACTRCGLSFGTTSGC